ncbi:MAG: type I-B CRISPR-associated protein Cas7/Csh2 [Methanobacteriaceae archaeon]
MNRSELVFLYDVTYANPNGDPLDENKPRIDEETEINLVTDVRLKRTIRDYLYDFKDQDIFVREIEYEPGKIQDAKLRAEDYLLDENGEKIEKKTLKLEEMKKIMYENIVKNCVDVRIFGGTIPIEKTNKEKSSITLTGPVQFRFGRSLHKVEIKHIKGTGAFASSEGKQQKTFREEYVLPYSLIGFYGIINENAAKKTEMTEEDADLLLEGIWKGTKNLITRSKFGQMPRLLLKVEYKEENYFIGDLDKKIKIEHDLEDDKKLRNIKELKIDISELSNALKLDKNKIESISIKCDPAATFKIDDNEVTGKNLLNTLKENDMPVAELEL